MLSVEIQNWWFIDDESFDVHDDVGGGDDGDDNDDDDDEDDDEEEDDDGDVSFAKTCAWAVSYWCRSNLNRQPTPSTQLSLSDQMMMVRMMTRFNAIQGY